jgi:hypothetical protein
MTFLKIKNEDFKTIINYTTSSCMDGEEVLLVVKDERVTLFHTDTANGALYKIIFNIETDMGEISLGFKVSDLKSANGLIEDKDLEIIIDETGRTIFKFGKIKKKIPQMSNVKTCTINPKVPLKTKISFSDAHKKEILTLLKDAPNIQAETVTVITKSNELIFILEDSSHLRNTEVEYYSNEFETFEAAEDTVTTFGLEYFTPLIKNKIEGSKAFLEFGHNLPMKLSQEFTNGIGYMLIGPRMD